MKLIDIHCHIDIYGKEKGKIGEIVKRAREKNVGIIVNNGVDVKSNRKTLELSFLFPEIKAAMGVYPINALSMPEEEIDIEIKFIEKNRGKIIMIGEIGIDLKESDNLQRQIEIFEKFIKLATKLEKPIAVHSRNAEEECISVLERLKAKEVLMHCFSGGMKLVKRIVENGWYLSIPASVKYNVHFQKIVEIVPLENMFCETDSPYLHPDRLQNNEPANVVESYKKIAEIKRLELKLVVEKVWGNWERLR